MNATEQLVEDILGDRVKIDELDLLQMEAVIDFMRKNLNEIAESAETDDEEQYAEGLLTLVDLIEGAAEARFVNQASGAWEQTIEASMARGNSYFELENYIIQ